VGSQTVKPKESEEPGVISALICRSQDEGISESERSGRRRQNEKGKSIWESEGKVSGGQSVHGRTDLALAGTSSKGKRQGQKAVGDGFVLHMRQFFNSRDG